MTQTKELINIDKDVNEVLKTWQEKTAIKNPVQKELYLEMLEQMANLFSVGSFYYFILNFETFKVDMISEGLKTVLGIEPRVFDIEELLSLMHPDDIVKMSTKEKNIIDFLLKKIPRSDLPLYKAVYLMRYRHVDGTYKTILHQSKAIVVSEDGMIQKTLCIHTDVSYLNIPFDHKVSIISNSRPCYQLLDGETEFGKIQNERNQDFSLREKEILVKISEGKDFNRIAEELYISPNTVNTHKRNILHKSGCKNTAELMAKCIRQGVI